MYLIYIISFGWVLWHINLCKLFNAKYYFKINIKYFVWLRFIVGYFKFFLYINIKDMSS